MVLSPSYKLEEQIFTKKLHCFKKDNKNSYICKVLKTSEIVWTNKMLFCFVFLFIAKVVLITLSITLRSILVNMTKSIVFLSYFFTEKLSSNKKKILLANPNLPMISSIAHPSQPFFSFNKFTEHQAACCACR